MDLAVSLSEVECKQTLKHEALKRKKIIPPPKYLCLPETLTASTRVCFLEFDHDICTKLKSTFQVRGKCPELSLKSAKEIKTLFSKYNLDEVQCLRTSEMRCTVIKQVKKDWMKSADNNLFWSHIILGVNQVVRALENSSSSKILSSTTSIMKLKYIFLDSGWYTSPLGHHLKNLCEFANTKLLIIKPTKSLLDLVNTPFKNVKKLIAVGICESSEIPLDLDTLIKLIDSSLESSAQKNIPVLDSSERRNEPAPTISIKQPLCNSESTAPSSNDTLNTFSTNKGEPWENFHVDPTIYSSNKSVVNNDKIFAASEFWSYMTKLASSDRNCESLYIKPMSNKSELEISDYQINPAYQQPLVQGVMPQTHEHREKRKAQRRKKIKVKSSISG